MAFNRTLSSNRNARKYLYFVSFSHLFVVLLLAQRYVRCGYASESCHALDQDGACLPAKPEPRLHFACVTVGLETQVCYEALSSSSS